MFETPAVTAPLHMTGEFVADLWLTTSMSDAHITAKLQVLGADGSALAFEGSNSQELGTWGARSLRHLAPMPDGYFVQEAGEPAPTGTPMRVPIRFQPNDLVVPAGGKLRLTIAGGTAWARETTPSGNESTITLLHDCEHASALRFLTARPDGPLIDVRETDEKGPPAGGTAPARGVDGVDGGGLSSGPVCGRAPERLASFGPESAVGWPVAPPVTPARSPSTAPRPLAPASLRVRILRARLRRALRRGLRVRVTCTGDCRTYRARIHLTRAMARRLRIARIVAKGRPRTGAGTRTLTVRFTAKARRRLRRVRRLRLTATLIAGRDRATHTVLLRR